jgi:hypothetical protein
MLDAATATWVEEQQRLSRPALAVIAIGALEQHGATPAPGDRYDYVRRRGPPTYRSGFGGTQRKLSTIATYSRTRSISIKPPQPSRSRQVPTNAPSASASSRAAFAWLV